MIVPTQREATPQSPLSLPKVLLVEGTTDARFFEALAATLKLDAQIEIRTYGGKDKLRLYLKVFATMAGFSQVSSIGIVRDADDNAASARQSVNDAVVAAKVPNHAKVTIAIVPNDQEPGMIETLCVASIQANVLYPAVTAFEESLQAIGEPLPTTAAIARHRAQVYLATQKKLQLCPGIAAQKGIWPLDEPVFGAMKQFLQSL